MNVYELVLSCMPCTEIRLDIYKLFISCQQRALTNFNQLYQTPIITVTNPEIT